MKTAFLDTSTINWFIENRIECSELSNIFQDKSFIPVVGMDTVYELARCFKVDAYKARLVFSLLKDFSPVYSCKRDMLYKREIDFLLYSNPMDPFLDGFTRQELERRINDFSLGIFDRVHSEFIDARQFSLEDCRRKLWSRDNTTKKGILFKDYVNKWIRPDNLTVRTIRTIHAWLHELITIKLSEDEIINFITNLDKLN